LRNRALFEACEIAVLIPEKERYFSFSDNEESCSFFELLIISKYYAGAR